MKLFRQLKTVAVLAAFVCLLAASAKAQFTFVTNSGAITITGYTGSGGDVSIPGTINGYPVTYIGPNAFYAKASITSVAIPSSVITIGNFAFGFCSGLTNIAVPSGVINIGNSAFQGCFGLKNVTISESVLNIGYASFLLCSSLTNITVSAASPKYTSVGGVLFDKSMTMLIAYPEGLEGNYTIPGSVHAISIGAFQFCSGLGAITIPNSVTSIGNLAFNNCVNLTNVVMGDSVTNIGTQAFYYCLSLTNITIPGSVSILGTSVFAYCTNLHQVYFQSNAPSVNGGAGSADTTVFQNAGTGIVYYHSGFTGWEATFGGWPTAVVQTDFAPASIGGYTVFITLTNYGGSAYFEQVTNVFDAATFQQTSSYVDDNYNGNYTYTKTGVNEATVKTVKSYPLQVAGETGTNRITFTSATGGNITHNWPLAGGGYETATGTFTIVASPTFSPFITAFGPTNSSLLAGSNLSLSVTASGNPTPVYQWLFNGVQLNGQTTSTLMLNNAQTTNSGNYAVVVSNSVGSVTSMVASVTVSNPVPATLYPQDLVLYLPFGGLTNDFSGLGNHGIITGGVSAVSTDGIKTFQFDGSSGYLSTTLVQTNPQNLSVVIWFKTTTTAGGTIIGMADAQFGPVSYDRIICMDATGQIRYYTWVSGWSYWTTSPNSYNDGLWHQAAVTMSSTNGSKLFLDGIAVATNVTQTAGQGYNGWWRLGYDNHLASYRGYFNGYADNARVYKRVLTASDVASIYSADIQQFGFAFHSVSTTNIIETMPWQYMPTLSGGSGNYTFSLSNAPSGMTVNASSGAITWTPTEAQGPSTNTVTCAVSQSGSVVAWTNLTVVVLESNLPLSFSSSPVAQQLYATTTLTLNDPATDADMPANALTYAIVSAPSGVTVNPATGQVSWTPTSGQVGTWTIYVSVTDYNPWAVNSQNLSATNSFQVTVLGLAPPSFTQQPTNAVVSAGAGFDFTSLVTGFPPSTYQWQFSTNNSTWINISGATSPGYTLTSSSETNIGYYRLVAANSQGTNSSNSARLTLVNISMYAGVTIYGPIGAIYDVQSTPSLNSNWVTVTNIALPSQPYTYIDYSSPTNKIQFYKAVPQ